jgi:hypothetical protein
MDCDLNGIPNLFRHWPEQIRPTDDDLSHHHQTWNGIVTEAVVLLSSRLQLQRQTKSSSFSSLMGLLTNQISFEKYLWVRTKYPLVDFLFIF